MGSMSRIPITTDFFMARDRPKALEFLDLDGERYVVVGTVLILLKMVSEYCK